MDPFVLAILIVVAVPIIGTLLEIPKPPDPPACPTCKHPEHFPWCKAIVNGEMCWCDLFTEPEG